MASRFIRRAPGLPPNGTGSQAGFQVDARTEQINYRVGNAVLALALASNPAGKSLYVTSVGAANAGGRSWADAYGTVQAAVDAASAGDVIYIAPGGYDEALTISTGEITLVGVGGAGSVALAPSAEDAVAITVSGTSAARTGGVTLINVGGEGNGTGGGLHVHGNIRRFRAYNGKYEGGAFAVTLESTAEGSVADTRLEGNEFAWAVAGVKLLTSGGGDPVTQTRIEGNFFHNIETDGVMNVTTHSADVWVVGNVFAATEAAAETTQYIDLAVADTTGLVAGNYFATTVFDTASFAIAAGVLWTGNQAQAEGPATGGGTAGRPD